MIPLIAAASAIEAAGKVADVAKGIARRLSGNNGDAGMQDATAGSFANLVAAHGSGQAVPAAGPPPAPLIHGHPHGKAPRPLDQVA
jgi:hypothetical protein